MKRKLLHFTFLTVAIIAMMIYGCSKDDNNNSNQPPTCQITAPPSGYQIEAGQIVTISVDANDGDGTIEEVRFFVDDIGKGTAKIFPYNYSWNTTGESDGSHTLKATAIDNNGEQTTDEISVELTQGGGGGISEPCPGLETITYGGQVYNTVLIGNQCWLKENLNYEAGNSWCYDNDPSNCDTYGRLYDWETALTVCPPGWHLPSDDEWKILEGTVDSQYPVGDPEWDDLGWRGLDAAKNLKSSSGWYNNGNGTDLYGFGALPGGSRHSGGTFDSLGRIGCWWSSSESSGTYVWYRNLDYDYGGSGRGSHYKTNGFSVRCLKDN